MIHEIDVALDIVHMDAIFGDGILHVGVVDEAGVGWLYQVRPQDGVVNELRMPRSDLRKISLWIDDDWKYPPSHGDHGPDGLGRSARLRCSVPRGPGARRLAP